MSALSSFPPLKIFQTLRDNVLTYIGFSQNLTKMSLGKLRSSLYYSRRQYFCSVHHLETIGYFELKIVNDNISRNWYFSHKYFNNFAKTLQINVMLSFVRNKVFEGAKFKKKNEIHISFKLCKIKHGNNSIF